jgi:hypothetical protein
MFQDRYPRGKKGNDKLQYLTVEELKNRSDKGPSFGPHWSLLETFKKLLADERVIYDLKFHTSINELKARALREVATNLSAKVASRVVISELNKDFARNRRMKCIANSVLKQNKSAQRFFQQVLQQAAVEIQNLPSEASELNTFFRNNTNNENLSPPPEQNVHQQPPVEQNVHQQPPTPLQHFESLIRSMR